MVRIYFGITGAIIAPVSLILGALHPEYGRIIVGGGLATSLIILAILLPAVLREVMEYDKHHKDL